MADDLKTLQNKLQLKGLQTQVKTRASPTDVVAQGLSFGLADEIAGAAAVTADKALGLFGVRPSRPAGEVFEQARAAKEQQIENVPTGVRIPLEIGGGLVTGAAAGRAALTGLSKIPGVSKLPGLAKTAIVGGGEGAVAGAAFSQPGERLAGATLGAGTGLVLGVTVPLTISGISKAINTSPQLRQLGTAGRQSARRVLEALKSDDITLDQAQARLGRLGSEAVVADVGEENVKQLAQAVTGTAGKGRRQAGRVLGQRSKGAAQRVVQAIKGVVSGEDAGDVTERLIQERSRAARPLYERALSVGVIDDPLINQMIGKKVIKEAGGKTRLVGLERVVKSRGKKRVVQQGGSSPIVNAIKEAKRLDPDLADLPDNHMVLLDRAYKALGGKANKARVSGDGTLSSSLNDIRVRFRERLVELNPAYGDALDTFAGQSNLIDALDLGKDVFKPKTTVTAKMVDALTDSEREMFKVGLADALIDKVESGVTGQAANSAKRLLRTPKIEKQIKAAFGDDLRGFREFKAALLKELEFAETSGIRFGSRTAPLDTEINRVGAAVDVADAAVDLTSGAPVRSALSLARRATKPGPGITPEVNEELGRLLFSPDLNNLRLVEQNALGRATGNSAALPLIGGGNASLADLNRRRR